MMSKDSINEGRLASIWISSDKDFGQDVLKVGVELAHVGQTSPDAFIDQLGNQ